MTDIRADHLAAIPLRALVQRKPSDALARVALALQAATGRAPLILEEYRSEVRAVAAAVTSLEASLVVVPAGRGAEAVAGAAPCSVLVCR